jgi:hypothetical protein
MMTAAKNSWIGLQNNEALSCVDTIPQYFNILDPEVLKNPQMLTENVCDPAEFFACIDVNSPSSAAVHPQTSATEK